MPRTWVGKTNRGVDAKILKRAAEEVKKHLSGQWHESMVSAMLSFRYWQKFKLLKDQGSWDLPLSVRTVFNREQKEILGDYISQAADIYFRLTPREVSMIAGNRVE